MALVTLVVVGHACTLLPDDGLVGHFYDFLYAWHIPAFVLVAGYLSRTFEYTPERLWNLVRTVAVPYVVFECLMAFFRIYVGGDRLAGPVHRPALAAVVPHRADLLAAGHADLPGAAGRRGRAGRDRPVPVVGHRRR